MKSQLSYLLILLLLGVLPAQAGFWDSLKKGLGMKGGETAVEAKVVEEASVVETKEAALPLSIVHPIDASDVIIWSAANVTNLKCYRPEAVAQPSSS